MRLVCIVAETAFAVFFVLAVVAVKEFNTAIALERQNMRCDAIQKPSIVTNYDGAARKVFKSFFESSHRVHIEVVRRFVEQDDIRAALEHLCEVNAVAFAARKLADAFLLVRT